MARDLKYATHDMDLEQLAKELHSEANPTNSKDDSELYGESKFVERS